MTLQVKRKVQTRAGFCPVGRIARKKWKNTMIRTGNLKTEQLSHSPRQQFHSEFQIPSLLETLDFLLERLLEKPCKSSLLSILGPRESGIISIHKGIVISRASKGERPFYETPKPQGSTAKLFLLLRHQTITGNLADFM